MNSEKRRSSLAASENNLHGRIISSPDSEKFLDPIQLNQLEQSFRTWADSGSREDVRTSRRRILLIFLIIRYTGAKLSEVLTLDPLSDIDLEKQLIVLGKINGESGRSVRTVALGEALCREIEAIISDENFIELLKKRGNVDPGFVRRKFYERAEECKIAKQLGAPEILRKSRGIELMQSNMPLPAVQMLLGHSTPNLTSSYLSFSEEDLQQVARLFMEKESGRKTSARNSFFGKIEKIVKGDIQAQVELMTIGGDRITTIITIGSLKRLGLREGALITAEVKAPYVILQRSGSKNECSADNMLHGVVERITEGEINTEYIVRMADGTEICSLITTESSRRIALEEKVNVKVLFNAFAVLLSE